MFIVFTVAVVDLRVFLRTQDYSKPGSTYANVNGQLSARKDKSGKDSAAGTLRWGARRKGRISKKLKLPNERVRDDVPMVRVVPTRSRLY